MGIKANRLKRLKTSILILLLLASFLVVIQLAPSIVRPVFATTETRYFTATNTFSTSQSGTNEQATHSGTDNTLGIRVYVGGVLKSGDNCICLVSATTSASYKTATWACPGYADIGQVKISVCSCASDGTNPIELQAFLTSETSIQLTSNTWSLTIGCKHTTSSGGTTYFYWGNTGNFYNSYISGFAWTKPVPSSDSVGPSSAYANCNVTFYSHWNANIDAGSYGNMTWNVTGYWDTTSNIAISSGWINFSLLTPNVGVQFSFLFSCNSTGYGSANSTTITMTVTIDMLDLQSQNNDVVFSNSTSGGYYLSPAQIGYDDVAGCNDSLRFYGLSGQTNWVPRNTVISNATLVLNAYSTNNTGSCYVRTYASLDSSTITDRTTNILFAKVTLTMAYVDWLLPSATAGSDFVSPNLASVVQELVNNALWSVGDNIVLVTNYVNGTGQRMFYSYSSTVTITPRLYLQWAWNPQVIAYYTNDTLATNRYLNYGFKVFDWQSLQYFKYQWNATGANANSSMIAVVASTYPYYWCNFSDTMGYLTDYAINVNATLFVNETLTGTWYGAPSSMLYPLHPLYNSTDFVQLDGCSQNFAFRHTTGRKIFWDNNTNQYIAFYSNGTDAYYAFSPDGVNWYNKTDFHTFAAIGDCIFPYLLKKTGSSDVFVEYNRESTADNVIYFRKGTIYSNCPGNLTWAAGWQTVIANSSATEVLYPEGIVADSTGHAYLFMENITNFYEGNATMWILRNAATDGTWQNSTGFPTNCTLNMAIANTYISNGTIYEIAPCMLSNDNIAALIMADPVGVLADTPIIIFCNSAGTVTSETPTASVKCESRDSGSMVIDSSDQLHFVYVDNTQTIDYYCRFSNASYSSSVVSNYHINNPLTDPQITLDNVSQRLYVSWFASDNYLYYSFLSIGSLVWASTVRSLVLPNNDVPVSTGNVALSQANNHLILFGCQDSVTHTLYTYLCNVTNLYIPITVTYTFSGTTICTGGMYWLKACEYILSGSTSESSLLESNCVYGLVCRSESTLNSSFSLNYEFSTIFSSVLSSTSLFNGSYSFMLVLPSSSSFNSLSLTGYEFQAILISSISLSSLQNTGYELSLVALSSSVASSLLQGNDWFMLVFSSMFSSSSSFNSNCAFILICSGVSSFTSSNNTAYAFQTVLSSILSSTSVLNMNYGFLFVFPGDSLFASSKITGYSISAILLSNENSSSSLETNLALSIILPSILVSNSSSSSTLLVNVEYGALFNSIMSAVSLASVGQEVMVNLGSSSMFSSMLESPLNLLVFSIMGNGSLMVNWVYVANGEVWVYNPGETYTLAAFPEISKTIFTNFQFNNVSYPYNPFAFLPNSTGTIVANFIPLPLPSSVNIGSGTSSQGNPAPNIFYYVSSPGSPFFWLIICIVIALAGILSGNSTRKRRKRKDGATEGREANGRGDTEGSRSGRGATEGREASGRGATEGHRDEKGATER